MTIHEVCRNGSEGKRCKMLFFCTTRRRLCCLSVDQTQMFAQYKWRSNVRAPRVTRTTSTERRSFTCARGILAACSYVAVDLFMIHFHSVRNDVRVVSGKMGICISVTVIKYAALCTSTLHEKSSRRGIVRAMMWRGSLYTDSLPILLLYSLFQRPNY